MLFLFFLNKKVFWFEKYENKFKFHFVFLLQKIDLSLNIINCIMHYYI